MSHSPLLPKHYTRIAQSLQTLTGVPWEIEKNGAHSLHATTQGAIPPAVLTSLCRELNTTPDYDQDTCLTLDAAQVQKLFDLHRDLHTGTEARQFLDGYIGHAAPAQTRAHIGHERRDFLLGYIPDTGEVEMKDAQAKGKIADAVQKQLG